MRRKSALHSNSTIYMTARLGLDKRRLTLRVLRRGEPDYAMRLLPSAVAQSGRTYAIREYNDYSQKSELCNK